MAKIELRRKALLLRQQGKSYSQIKKELNLSKSTLSVWLRRYPLSKEQIHILRDINEQRIERFRETMRKKREERANRIYQQEREKWLTLNERELFLAGLFLYWGEGDKGARSTVSISNTDPHVVCFSLYWFINCLKVPKEKIRIALHLYSDMDMNEAMGFWSRRLNMPLSSFEKPYIKISKRTSLDEKGFGHGTCGIRTYSTELKQSVLMAIKAIADYYVAVEN